VKRTAGAALVHLTLWRANEDDEPVRSSNSSFSRPTSTASSGASLSKHFRLR
jgi:hypothetical protein